MQKKKKEKIERKRKGNEGRNVKGRDFQRIMIIPPLSLLTMPFNSLSLHLIVCACLNSEQIWVLEISSSLPNLFFLGLPGLQSSFELLFWLDIVFSSRSFRGHFLKRTRTAPFCWSVSAANLPTSAHKSRYINDFDCRMVGIGTKNSLLFSTCLPLNGALLMLD